MKSIFMAVAAAAVVAFWTQNARSEMVVDLAHFQSSHILTMPVLW